MAQEKKHSATSNTSSILGFKSHSEAVKAMQISCMTKDWQLHCLMLVSLWIWEVWGGEGGGGICSGKVGRTETHPGIAVWMLNASRSKEAICNGEMFVLTVNALQRNLPLLTLYPGHNSSILFFAQINQDGNTCKFAQYCRRNCWFETQSGVSPESEWDTVFWDRRKLGCLQQTICQLVRLVSSLQCVSLS